jgi:hypothetical protein
MQNLERGEDFFAEVLEGLARAQDLIANNAEMIAARLEPHDETRARTAIERAQAARERQRTALVFARFHRDRRQMARAHFHEYAAEVLAEFALIAEDEADSDARHPDRVGLADVHVLPRPATSAGQTDDRRSVGAAAGQ